jgi:hypothetical protein
MKYMCFGYLDTKRWATVSESEQNAAIDAAADTMLRRMATGSGEGLKALKTPPPSENGKTSVTDGPYAETKELLGGFLILEARDLNHAIQLLSNHPGMEMGPWEIRPVEDMSQMIRESERRRSVAK